MEDLPDINGSYLHVLLYLMTLNCLIRYYLARASFINRIPLLGTYYAYQSGLNQLFLYPIAEQELS